MAVVMMGAGLVGAAGANADDHVAAGSAPAARQLATKPLPEQNKKAGPRDDQGYYLGHPTPTYSWHGCTATATRQAPRSDPDPIGTGSMPAVRKGTKQSAVKFTTVPNAAAKAGWTVRWAVKNAKKWKICGVQVSGGFSHPSNPNQIYVAQGGYTSSTKKGSTATSGPETMVLRVPKNSRWSFQVPKQWEKKKLKTEAVYAVTVYVKKKK